MRKLRKAKRLTLRDLAALVGVGFTYLSRVETSRLKWLQLVNTPQTEDEDKALRRAVNRGTPFGSDA